MGNQVQKGISDIKNHDLQTCYTFEIDNFTEKNNMINSPRFLSGGCEWYLRVYPKRYDSDDYMSLFLSVHNPEPMRTGWKKIVNYRFSLLNQSGKVLHEATEKSATFFEQVQSWGHKTLPPLNELKKEGFLEKNKLIIKVEVKVVEVINEAVVTGKETLDFNGFEVLYTQITPVNKIFTKYPDIALNFRPKAKVVKTAYMNLLLGLIETLRKAPKSFSENELSNAHSELSELIEAGFKLDWLKTKLEKVSLDRKNEIADGLIGDGSKVEEVEERIKNLELTLSNLKDDLKKRKAKSADSAKLLSFDEIIGFQD